MHWEIRIPLFAWELGTASLTSSPCTALISALARSEQALNLDVFSPERVFGDDCAKRAVLASARTSSKAQPQTYISFFIPVRSGLDEIRTQLPQMRRHPHAAGRSRGCRCIKQF